MVRGLEIQLQTKSGEVTDLTLELDNANQLIAAQMEKLKDLAIEWYVVRRALIIT